MWLPPTYLVSILTWYYYIVMTAGTTYTEVPCLLQPSLHSLESSNPGAARGLRKVECMEGQQLTALLAVEGLPLGTTREAYVQLALQRMCVEEVQWQSTSFAQVRKSSHHTHWHFITVSTALPISVRMTVRMLVSMTILPDQRHASVMGRLFDELHIFARLDD